MNRTNHKRTEELAREVLKDLKCLEHAKFRCGWLGGDAKKFPNKELAIPCLIIEFDYPKSADVAPSYCISFPNQGFANGSPAHDARIKDIIRRRVEGYLKMISVDPGRNAPQDMRLNDEFYS